MASSFFDEDVFASTILQALGNSEEIIYVPRGGDPYTLTSAKFRQNFREIEIDSEDREVETYAPRAWILESECPPEPRHDILQVGDQDYEILGRVKDDHGFAMLILAKK